MKRFWLGVAMATMVSACSGGNPWVEDGDGGGETPPDIPEDLLGDLEGFKYDPVAKTLIVRGTSLDDTPYEAVYTRKPALDVPGYEAYTTQDSSLDRHVTAYVQERDRTRAAIVVTGGQFGHFFGGSHYSRSGAYDPPTITDTNGLVSYAGTYVGVLNSGDGIGADLLPVTGGTPDEVLPVQAARVVGSVFINADFVDNIVNGTVYDRSVVDHPGIDISEQQIILSPGSIENDGTFTSDAQEIDYSDANPSRADAGTYGGIFGGTDAAAVAGTLHAKEHLGVNSEEYGLFVLAQCGTADADAICNQPNP